ncbi:MAG: amino acid adenylation domain-containing protein, partial [bacterium]|nr:amino acid adenylation domain-containing protein [bacterium]
RGHIDLEKIIGMFVNTLVLRSNPEGNKRFDTYHNEVKAKTLLAFENGEAAFEEIVEKVGTQRDTGRNPLFDIMFVLQNQAEFKGQNIGNTDEIHAGKETTAQFDITIQSVQVGSVLSFTMIYCTKLFEEETIKRYIRYFKRIVSAVVQNPEQEIAQIEILSEEEKNQLLYQFNKTGTDYPKEKTIHELFEEQVTLHPDRVAVTGIRRGPKRRYQTMTYRELSEGSNRLAETLKAKGVTQENIVALMGESTPEVITAILGILKTGAAYMPLNVKYPPERIRIILQDSNAKVLITTAEYAEYAGKIAFNGESINIEAPRETAGEKPREQSIDNEKITPANTAYIIYTSGSTGKPKGVVVQHRNVVRLVKKTNYITFTTRDRIMQTGALEFDASTFEIWGSILNGLSLYQVQETSEIISPESFNKILKKHQVTIAWLTSPLFNQLSQSTTGLDAFASLRVLLTGGDVLSPPHINRVRKKYPRLKIINGYGPTENTTFSTTYLIDKHYEKSIPIGTPIANSTAYIVDKNFNPVPVGVPGELLVGGDGVARGYLNSPELTAEKFVMPPAALRGVADDSPRAKGRLPLEPRL